MEYTEKSAKLKKPGKIFKTVSLCSGIAVALLIVLFCLMPATQLTTDIGKYTKGYNYYGWQLAFLGCGYPPLKILCLFEEQSTIAGDYVPNTWDFDTNAALIIGIVLPILAIIVCAAVSSRMKNRGKAVCEFVTAGALVIGGIILACCASVSVGTATDMGAGVGFKNQYLLPAIEAGTYKTLFYPIFLCIVCVLVAAFKTFRGMFLIYQRNYVRANKPVSNGNNNNQ